MKRVMIVLGIVFSVFVLTIGALIFIVFRFTADLPDAAEAFFRAAQRGDMENARGQLSSAFQASTDADQLRRFLDSHGLDSYREASWSSRNISGSQGELEGTVTTQDGGRVPLTIKFVSENEQWKIYAIHATAAGVSSDATAQARVPSADERLELVKQSMHDFALSAAQGDMSHFHSTLAPRWRDSTTTEALNEVFAQFFVIEGDLRVLDSLQPRLQLPVAIDANGVLSLDGHYDTRPSRVDFSLKYEQDQGRWQLIGVNINIGANPDTVEEPEPAD